MATPVKERIKTELEQAKEESKVRAERIGDILKAAASATFEEIKGGSAELQVLTRKSLSELLVELEEVPNGDRDAASQTELDLEVDTVSDPKTAPPSWRNILARAFVIVRDRKGDWFQQLKAYFNQSAVKVDADMTEEYGDRYLKVRAALKRFIAWYETTRTQANAPATAPASGPVNIEVVDDAATQSAVPRKVTVLEAEGRDEAVQ